MKRLLGLMFAVLGFSVLLNAQVWTEAGPSSRHSHSAVFDPVSGQMIIFGGQETTTSQDLNDVWLGITATNQNDQFAQLSPNGTLPSGRYGHVATYDSSTNRMTVFGGATGLPAPCANDVWILDGANGKNGTPAWLPESPTGTAPTARAYSGGSYDSTSNELIIFGGNNCAKGYFNDVWVMTNANGEGGTPAWHQLSTSGTPPAARESASVVYDTTNNVLTVYAGDAGSIPFSDVWTLSHANGSGGTPTWTHLLPTGTAPRARTGQSTVYDSANNRMIVFGGNYRTVTLTDTWVLTSANGLGNPSWIQITPTGTAPSLAYHSAVFNASLDYMYVFAGSSSANKLTTNSHAFTLTNANGLKTGPKWVLGGPAVRYSQSAFYDSQTNAFFVWGGQHSKSNLNFGDYWEASSVIGSSNLKWTVITAKSGPSARYGQTGVYDPNSNRLMIFGGSNGTCQNDYHVLQHANVTGGTPTWSTIATAGTAPSQRTLQASAYDPTSDTIMIFGGWNCSSGYFNDVWILTNANDVSAQPTWTQLSPAGTPPSVRESSTAVYDPTSNSLIIHGGDEGGTPFSDMWVLSNANGTGGPSAWTQLQPSNQGPGVRSGHTATYDAANNIMTLYGGFNGSSILGDVWMLSGANGRTGSATWTQGVSGEPRRFHSSAYDPVSNEMISFGGATSIVPLTPISDLDTMTDANGLQ